MTIVAERYTSHREQPRRWEVRACAHANRIASKIVVRDTREDAERAAADLKAQGYGVANVHPSYVLSR